MLKRILLSLAILLGIATPAVALAAPTIASATSGYICENPAPYGGLAKVCFQIVGNGYCVDYMDGEVDNLSAYSETWSVEVFGPSGGWVASKHSGTVGAYPGKAPWQWIVDANMIAGNYYAQYFINGVGYDTPVIKVIAGATC